MSARRYLLVTPCRNEAPYLRATIESTLAQTVTPKKWIFVDDGSTDDTPKILAEYAQAFPCIEVITVADRGARSVGPGVVTAFNRGLAAADVSEFDFLCKFDADIELPPRYFERLMEFMEQDEALGSVSGKMYERQRDGSLRLFWTGDEAAVGAVKFFRVECFEAIGGFVPEVGWDSIDGHACRARGWIARSLDDPELRFIHLRPMGSSQTNILEGRRRWGRGKYYMGSAWYYVLVASLYRMKDPPYVLGGMNIFLGYLASLIRRTTRFNDKECVRSLRRFELLQLLLGKRRAARLMDRRVRARRRGVRT